MLGTNCIVPVNPFRLLNSTFTLPIDAPLRFKVPGGEIVTLKSGAVVEVRSTSKAAAADNDPLCPTTSRYQFPAETEDAPSIVIWTKAVFEGLIVTLVWLNETVSCCGSKIEVRSIVPEKLFKLLTVRVSVAGCPASKLM